jgi:hypothetical protein
VIEGDDHRRRPLPPSVTPDDARTPVLDGHDDPTDPTDAPGRSSPSGSTAAQLQRGPVAEDETPPDADEGTEVREAEAGGPRDEVDVDDLLGRELGATLLEELPPPGETA